jgi:cytochrome b pre-mRNA-processing protein 3
MRQIGEAFYGRAAAYEAALAAEDEQGLAGALARNVFSGGPEHAVAPRRLAAYMMETVDRVARQDSAAFAQGRIDFPDPLGVPANPPAAIVA